MTPEEEYNHPRYHHPVKCKNQLTICNRYMQHKRRRKVEKYKLRRLRCPVHKKTLNRSGWELGYFGGENNRARKHNFSEYGKRKKKSFA